MPNGASSIHKQLRTELENYIKSQLFGKSPVLLSSLNAHIDDEGLLYQKPYIESSPAENRCRGESGGQWGNHYHERHAYGVSAPVPGVPSRNHCAGTGILWG